jgi:chromate transporter
MSFAAYLGAVAHEPPNGIAGAAIALTAIYLPSFLLVMGTLPFWSRLRDQRSWQSGLCGINAAVVGILAAALYRPVIMSSIFSVWDALLAAAGFSLLEFAKWPPLAVVLLSAFAGLGMALFL